MRSFVKKKENHSTANVSSASAAAVGEQIKKLIEDEQTSIISEQEAFQESHTLTNKHTGTKLTLVVPKCGVVKPLTLKEPKT